MSASPSSPVVDRKSPRQRAEEALTVLVHENGTGRISLAGLTLCDLKLDLVELVANAIADAEDAAARPTPLWADPQMRRYRVSEDDDMLLPNPVPDGQWVPYVDVEPLIVDRDRLQQEKETDAWHRGWRVAVEERDEARRKEIELTAQFVDLQTGVHACIREIQTELDAWGLANKRTIFESLQRLTALLADRAAPGGEKP